MPLRDHFGPPLDRIRSWDELHGGWPMMLVAALWRYADDSWRLQTWAHPLAVGQPMPTLPLWLADNLAVPLELEASYEETCRFLRIP
jgi:hypothetical protein